MSQITQVPRRPPVVRELSPTSYYPVALVPGQYSDHCKRYSPEELRRMPLNTAMELPKVNIIIRTNYAKCYIGG